MRNMLLGLAASSAAIMVPATPAAALDPETLTAASVTVHRGSGNFGNAGFGRAGHDRDRWHGHRRGFGRVVLNRWVDYQDRTFEPDSYNDWWHERPHRAFPRWISENAQTCDRRWWSGGVWRC